MSPACDQEVPQSVVSAFRVDDAYCRSEFRHGRITLYLSDRNVTERAMSGCPFTHPLDLDAYRDGMPYAALAEARAQGSFVHYEDPIPEFRTGPQ